MSSTLHVKCKFCCYSFRKKDVNAVLLKEDSSKKLNKYGWHCPICGVEIRSNSFLKENDKPN